VLVASAVLAILILLMTGTSGFFTKKIVVKSYFDNAGGLSLGAPVRLQGVDIGSVTAIRIVPDADKRLTPVEVTMKVSTKYRNNLRSDSMTALATAGVLGETYIDINSALARGPEAKDGDVLATRDTPDIQDVVRASQGTLQNMDALLKRLDRIVAFVESGQGSIGKVIYDPGLYNRINTMVAELQGAVNQVTAGKGTLGQLFYNDELYRKANTTVDKLNVVIDDLNAGKGTAGKLLKDPSLYDSANASIANVKQLTDDMTAGKGALGTLAKDQEFANKLKNTIAKLSNLADRMDAGEGTVGKLMRDPSVFNNTDQMLVESRELIKAMRQDPKKYLTIHLKIF